MLLKLLIFLFIPFVALAQNTKPLVSTDNSTQTCNTTRMVFSPGALSCSGSVATVTTSGGGSNVGIGTVNQEAVYTTTTSVGPGIITDTGTGVGIGSSFPSQALDVNGTARMTGFTLNQSTGTNYVLTDVSGNGQGVWQPGSSGSPWTLTDGVNTVANVGQVTVSGATVGGTTPNATLTISGGGGSQTPWAQDIQGADYQLLNAGNIGIGTGNTQGWQLDINDSSGSLASGVQLWMASNTDGIVNWWTADRVYTPSYATFPMFLYLSAGDTNGDDFGANFTMDNFMVPGYFVIQPHTGFNGRSDFGFEINGQNTVITGNVGIGTSAPTSGTALDIENNGSIKLGGVSRNTWPSLAGSDWSTAGGNDIYNTLKGNVGIGTSSIPLSYEFIVYDPTGVGASMQITSPTSVAELDFIDSSGDIGGFFSDNSHNFNIYGNSIIFDNPTTFHLNTGSNPGTPLATCTDANGALCQCTTCA